MRGKGFCREIGKQEMGNENVNPSDKGKQPSKEEEGFVGKARIGGSLRPYTGNLSMSGLYGLWWR